MKKMIFAVMTVMLMTGVSFAEFNLRTSFDSSGDYKMKSGGQSITFDTEASGTISGEYMRRAIGDYLVVGGGFEAMFPKWYKTGSYKFNDPFWFLPLYFSVQSNPIKPVPEWFVRLNLGYNIYYIDASPDHVNSFKGGLYYSFVTGWEFPIGLFVDITYAVYNGTISYESYWFGSQYNAARDIDTVYTRIGVGVGYKFFPPKRR